MIYTVPVVVLSTLFVMFAYWAVRGFRTYITGEDFYSAGICAMIALFIGAMDAVVIVVWLARPLP